jgi:hypothetical protein
VPIASIFLSVIESAVQQRFFSFPLLRPLIFIDHHLTLLVRLFLLGLPAMPAPLDARTRRAALKDAFATSSWSLHRMVNTTQAQADGARRSAAARPGCSRAAASHRSPTHAGASSVVPSPCTACQPFFRRVTTGVHLSPTLPRQPRRNAGTRVGGNTLCWWPRTVFCSELISTTRAQSPASTQSSSRTFRRSESSIEHTSVNATISGTCCACASPKISSIGPGMMREDARWQ